MTASPVMGHAAVPGPLVSVLVVDDEPISRAVLTGQLTQLGYRAVGAADGLEALAALQTLTIDLVLLDVQMPRMSGVEVLELMQRDEALHWVPVIVVSAGNQVEDVMRCLALGAEDYTVKPFNPTLLNARIRAVVARKQGLDRERAAHADLRGRQARAQQLLEQVLPPAIITRLTQGEEAIADTIPDATVMFADLANFTGLSERLPARRVVRMLDRVFSTFDLLAEQVGAEIIKTQGDAYLVASNVLVPQPNHPAVMADLALAMREAMGTLRAETDLPLEVRIGIHTGPVVAGSVGVRKLSYDIWGDTVNVASRMESHGIVGQIQVSEATYNRLHTSHHLTARGVIPIKGKGELPTYLLHGRLAV